MTDPTNLSSDSETQLSASQAKWKVVVDALLHPVIVIDELGMIQEANPTVSTVFGYDCEELIGRNVSLLMPEPFRSEHDGYLTRYKETGDKRVIGIGREVIAMRKNGETFPVLLSVGEADYHHTRSFVGIIYDLTEIKKQEARIVEAQKTEAISQLTAGIAHDFNNMLTVIQGNLEMLESQIAGEGERELLHEVLAALADGGLLVKQLLAFSRKQPLDPKMIDLNELVAGLLKLLRRTISEKIQFRDVLGSGIDTVVVDPQLLENAILNLVINARDAMPDGGRISVETDMVSADDVNPGADFHLPRGRYARIVIRDTGGGIPKDLISRIFEPFFTTKETSKGSGLGLSMAQGFARQSGGELLLESIPGEGTAASLLLPCKAGTEAQLHQQGADVKRKDGPTGGGETVLLVEDDPRVRRVNARRLEALGYTVLAAEDGPSALRLLLGHEEVDILFSDIVLPGGMLGTELAAKAHHMRPDLKILLTTGYAEDLASGSGSPYELLTKPFSAYQLATKVRFLLDN